jgi:3-isopropylmalate/(R)-2-methylmalate dehydratase small subunit
MEKFTTVRGKVLPLPRADVDTDQIIPAQYMKRIERTGYGPYAFAAWRKDPDFVLNDRRYDGAPILVTGPNFGCGSSREHAPWALEGLGVRAVIAPSFADIFRNNCAKVGILTVVLPQKDIDQLIHRAEDAPGFEAVVDLEAQTVRFGAEVRQFELHPHVRHMLLNGLDDVSLTLEHEDEIAGFERSRRLPYAPTTADV